MITFSKFGSYGRNGNMLFQWAFLAAQARKKGVSYVLPDHDIFKWFDKKPPIAKITGQRVNEPHYRYDPSPYEKLDYSRDLDFLGYFQSEKYFDEQTRSDLKLREIMVEQVRAKHSKYLKGTTIAIGVRRGDYLTLPYVNLSANYYFTALQKHFPEWRTCKLVFISDDPDWCRLHFGCLPNAVFPQAKDMEQLVLMSLCDHFIIANSTFHWWAAWLGEKPHTKVVQPTRLFKGELLEKYGDINFYSDRWLFHEEQKIDLTDLTFTIPVMHDHPDRRFNLDLCITMLQKCFDTNIMVAECKTNQFSYISQWARYVRYDHKEFHRTKMLNDMAKACHTPYIANWDADVMVPPVQLWATVDSLRNGAEMAYPYDNIFHRIRKREAAKIFPTYDLGVFASDPANGTESVGGAVLWNRDKYFEIGGENEYMISYAPEDVERYERAKRLKVKIFRTKGNLYHFDHWCGPDSSSTNPHFKKNKALLDHQRAMNEKQLWDYINSWPWHAPYTGSYYETIQEDAIRSRNAIFTFLDIYEHKNMVDVGCGIGQWGVGLKRYTGIDYRVPTEKLLIPRENYIDQDIRKPFYLDRKFELVLCLEVAEHIEEPYADILIDNLCDLVAPDGMILFSAAIPYQGGNNHLNEQWQTYWAKKFYDKGFGGIQYEQITQLPAICDWYAQNLVVYSRELKPGGVIDYVLPRYYTEILKHRCSQ